jgi:hypothetical protein
MCVRRVCRASANSTAHFQSELAIDTNIVVTDTYVVVADARVAVADARGAVADTQKAVAGTHAVVADTYPMVANIHRSVLTGQVGTSSNNRSVGATCHRMLTNL